MSTAPDWLPAVAAAHAALTEPQAHTWTERGVTVRRGDWWSQQCSVLRGGWRSVVRL